MADLPASAMATVPMALPAAARRHSLRNLVQIAIPMESNGLREQPFHIQTARPGAKARGVEKVVKECAS